ncbi:MAG: hypothetical protein IJL63_00765 [Clostridia bacterium]|nr:hypothetical protein [Clostridia bacterium]
MKKSDKKFHFSISALFNNNKFVFVFSLVAAFSIWLWVSINKSPVVENVIASVPVQIDLTDSIPSQLGLQVFGNNEYSVDVTVSGKKFVVNELTADDVKVTALTNYVDSAGNKTLTLKATNSSGKEFDIVSLSQNYISVFFDTLKETEFAVETNLTSELSTVVPDGCKLGTPILSKNTIVVSGPASEVSSITGVVASYKVTQQLNATTTVTPNLEFVGASSMQLTNVSFGTDDANITMTLPVLKEVTLPTAVTYKNAPANVLAGNVNIAITPATVTLGIPIEQIEQTKEIVVGSIDFSKINTGNNYFTFKSEDIADYDFDENVKEFKVVLKMADCESKSLNIPAENITVSKENSSYISVIKSQSVNQVKVIGPADQVKDITADMLSVSVDLSTVELHNGSNTVPVVIAIKGNTTCWVYGEYTVNVSCTAVSDSN